MCGTDIFLLVLSVLFPPISVWIKRGICSADSLINIALCCLGYIPGLIHAWYIVLRYPEPDEYASVPRDAEDGRRSRVTYYYVSHGQPRAAQPKPKYLRQGGSSSNTNNGASGAGYGTLNGSGNSSQPSAQFPGQETGTTNAFVGTAAQAQQGGGSSSSAAAAPPADAGEGSSSHPEHAPPSYEAATAGDHKIQSDE